jgi:Peptidase family M1 domain/ERAP1-like C-terminal domain/Peptidase M1 N-terminal domain
MLTRLIPWLLLAPILAFAQPRFSLSQTETRLPKTVLPSRVQLALDLDPASDTFSGDVRIQLRAQQAVPAIVLHAHALEADAAQLVRAGAAKGVEPRKLRVSADDKTQTWRLEPVDGRPIAAGSWTLQIRYRGRVHSTGEGLYRAEYRVGGVPTRMLATQLEAVHARRLLPVFDEPVFRTVFELTVRAPSGLRVLSNMPLARSSRDGKATRHRFTATPPMPSYLLAVSVGRFDVLAGEVDGIPLRIVTVPGKREQARFAMEVTRQVLPFYARYFGRPYALPKLDQIAVPTTREGAMEDWGLISYIEDALLFDPARSDENTRRSVFEVVAHEIAHQWFGNLVSVASWNEIWLNEAFATWMAAKAATHFHPEWQTSLRERSNVDRTMSGDATSATRAIRSGPVSEESVFEVFDGVTYVKGGAVLSMLEEWLGEARFQRGLAAYMRERAFKPATAGDLWAHLSRAAALPELAATAASWTDQPGFPVLSLAQRCEAGQTLVTLRQNRFSSQTEPLPGGPWEIPLRLVRGDLKKSLLMTGPEQTVSLAGCDPAPVLANAGGRGYYRVEYESALRASLVSGFATLEPADRVALVSDSYALAEAGRSPMADHIALLRAVPRVADASRSVLMAQGLTHWRALDRAFDGTNAQAPLRAAGQALFSPELDRLGWQVRPGDDSETRKLRSDLIQRLAQLGHAPTLARAHGLFASALAGEPSVHPSMRPAVLSAVGRHASEAEFGAMLGAMRAADSQEERWTLVNALTAGTNRSYAQRLLEEALTGRLPSDISSELPGAVGGEPSLSRLAYDFVVAHWSALSQLAGEGPFGGRNWLLPSAAAASSDPALARTLLLDQRRLAGEAGASTAARVAAAIENRSRLRAREATALAAGLQP